MTYFQLQRLFLVEWDRKMIRNMNDEYAAILKKHFAAISRHYLEILARLGKTKKKLVKFSGNQAGI
jgi:hypothetical protein